MGSIELETAVHLVTIVGGVAALVLAGLQAAETWLDIGEKLRKRQRARKRSGCNKAPLELTLSTGPDLECPLEQLRRPLFYSRLVPDVYLLEPLVDRQQRVLQESGSFLVPRAIRYCRVERLGHDGQVTNRLQQLTAPA